MRLKDFENLGLTRNTRIEVSGECANELGYYQFSDKTGSKNRTNYLYITRFESRSRDILIDSANVRLLRDIKGIKIWEKN